MTTSDDELWLVGIAWRLDRLRWVPRADLDKIVKRDGLCFWAYSDGDPPDLTGEDTPDRELATAYCAGCPVQAECLELELRMTGAHTVGIWGGLPEDDRRALHPHWLRRGERAEVVNPLDLEGGPCS